MNYVERFEKLGFGLFVHFGAYSVIGKGEWCKTLCHITDKQYENTVKKLNPTKNWAINLVKTAKKAGCKYITLTTRHHDGFSLYDTKGLTDYDTVNTIGRDLIKEFVYACNREEIVPFFYHTLLDWHNEDYKNDFPKYIDYLDKSIEILCTNYGKVGGFWFDGMWDKPNENWQEDRIYGTIRKYQPTAMIINNTGLSACGKVGHPEIDSVTFERGKPCFVDNSDKHRAGEMCQVLNDHWGYCKEDCNYKSVKELIENLVDCRKYNCNFLLNTGLKGNGQVNCHDACILEEIGKWIRKNKEFIYNIKSSGIECDGADIVTDGENYYAIIKDAGMGADPNVALSNDLRKVEIKREIESGVWLDNYRKIKFEGNTFYIEPFNYGQSYSIRIAKLKLKN